MTIKPWLLALHHGLSLQEALHSASLWSSTQSIETPGERKLHVRSGCMECFFFFSPDRSLGSMSCSHSYIRIVWLILNVSACPFLRPVTAGLCLKLLLKPQALPDGAAIKQAQSFPSADLLPRQGVRWEGLHSWREQLKKPTALSMHTQ